MAPRPCVPSPASGAWVVAGIKFCGLTRARDADLAVELGAEHVGVIFAGGPRLLSSEKAREVLTAVPSEVKRVGVFGTQDVNRIEALVESVRLDVIQLHAPRDRREIDELRSRLNVKVWTVVRVADGMLPADFVDLDSYSDAVVIDSLVHGALGGTGVATDWPALAVSLEARGRPRRLVLAGGLRPQNVARALSILQPDIVDVSSGIEVSPGVKDPALMRAFARSVLHTEIHT